MFFVILCLYLLYLEIFGGWCNELRVYIIFIIIMVFMFNFFYGVLNLIECSFGESID